MVSWVLQLADLSRVLEKPDAFSRESEISCIISAV